jgi:hypothetical protein
MSKLSHLAALALVLSLGAGPAMAAVKNAPAGKQETVADVVCPLIDASARLHGLPVAFLTRLIWRESSFQPTVTSPAGAEGVAQFMPGTATERGLANPYDPEEAIPKAAELLVDLKNQFGDLGLAAAAYNAGPGRLASWLAGVGSLPAETRAYVSSVTGHPVEDWLGEHPAATSGGILFPQTSCAVEVASLRASQPLPAATSPLTAPWGVQIAGSFSKRAAVAAYAQARVRYAAILGNVEPMVLGGRWRARGFASFYRVRAPAATRAEAEALCGKILRVGGACAVLRN